MICIVKSFSKKVQEKHNLSPYFAEYFFQLYNLKYGEDSQLDESKFDELVNSYKNRSTFNVENQDLLYSLNKFIQEKTNDGYIEFNNVTNSVKQYIKDIENSFGKDNVFAWTDKENKVHIKVNQPINYLKDDFSVYKKDIDIFNSTNEQIKKQLKDKIVYFDSDEEMLVEALELNNLNNIEFAIIGEKGAKSLDEAEETTQRLDNLNVAKQMDVEKKDSKTIKLATGWEKGADNKWRYEVEDFKINKEKVVEAIDLKDPISLYDIVDDSTKNKLDSLYKAYPWILDTEVIFLNPIEIPDDIDKEDIKGYVISSYEEPKIFINKKNFLTYDFTTGKTKFVLAGSSMLEDTILHELQHLIQFHEGFAIGAKNADFNSVHHKYYIAKTNLFKEEEEKLLKQLENFVEYDIKKYNTLNVKIESVKSFFKDGQLYLTFKEKYPSGSFFSHQYIFDLFEEDKNKFDDQLNKIRNLDIISDNLKKELFLYVVRLKRQYEKFSENFYSYKDFKYWYDTGEVEARNVSKRKNLSKEERLNKTLESTEDRSRDTQIVYFNKISNFISFERRKQGLYDRNDTSKFHLVRDNRELNNNIFNEKSENKYKKEIQDFIKSLKNSTNTNNEIYYLSNDKKRLFGINTNPKYFKENKKDGYGFELIDWYNLNKINKQQLNNIINGYNTYIKDKNYSNIFRNIVNDIDPRTKNLINDKLRLLKKRNGEIYGFAGNGKIYINKDRINPNTMVHEYSHLWCNAVMLNNRRLWEKIKDLLKNDVIAKAIKDEILGEDLYNSLKNNEDKLASEIIARLSGRINAKKLIDLQKKLGAENKTLFDKFVETLKEFWNWIGVNLFDLESINSIDEITDRIIYDLINKTNLGNNTNQNIDFQIQEEQAPFTENDIKQTDKGKESKLDNELESLENLESDKRVNVDNNSIFAKIHRWKQVTTLTAKEKQEMSDSIVKNFSYFINSFYEKPDKIKILNLPFDENYINDIINQIKSNNLTREQFIKKVTYKNLIDKYKFRILKNTKYNKKEIEENWDAIFFNGRNVLSETEGQTIKPNGLFSDLSNNIYDLFEEASSDTFEGKEEEEVEGWQIDNDRRSAHDSLSQEIRTLINLIPIEKSFTKWCGLRFEDGNALCKKILEICSSANSYNDMINRLKSMSNIYDWINPLINKIENSKNLKQLFFKNFKKNFQKRVILIRRGDNLEPFIINYDEEITKIKAENIKQYWMTGFNTMFFTFTGRLKNGDAYGYANEKNLKKITEVLNNIDKYKEIDSYDIILKNLGFDINIDVLKKVLNTPNEKQKLIKNISDLLNIISSIKSDDKPLNPFKVVKNRATNIYNMIKPYDPIYVESSTIQKGKNYYGYTYPSFLNDLFDKLKNVESLNNEEYRKLINSIYADDYLIDSNGNPRNLYLKDLLESKGFRNKIDRLNFLNFDGKEVKDMTARNLLHVQLSMFKNIYDDDNYAMYSCGVFSNKHQIQFITSRRYKSLMDSKDAFYQIFTQELDRIRDVISRAKDDNLAKVEFYDITKKQLGKVKNINDLNGDDFKQLVNSGAVFKHLSFLNTLLIDNNNSVGNKIRDYINNGDSTLLKESFDNLFAENGIFEKYFMNEYKQLVDNDLIPRNAEGEFYFSDNEVKNFVFNNFIAQIQFSQLLQIDLAYNKNAEDTQKRAAAFIAPGLKLDVNAIFNDKTTGKEIKFSDGTMRTVIINEQKIMSDVITVLDNIFTNKAKEFFPNEDPKKVSALANILITRLKDTYGYIGEDGKQHGGFKASDGQSWMSPTGYWKKLGMQGQNTEDIQEMIDKISKGNLNLSDIATILGQPQKPVVYGFQKMDYRDKDYEFKRKCIPTYIKDSEVTLLLADAIIRGAKEDSILTGFFELMEESHYDKTKWNNGKLKGNRGTYKQNGIDNITMSSAVKTGLKGAIDLSNATIKKYQKEHDCSKSQAVKELIKNKIYNDNGTYNKEYLIETSFEDYRIQQEVPPHLRDHKQQLGSQPRILMAIDIDPNDDFELDGESIKGNKLQEQYFKYCAAYYEIGKKEIEKRFGLNDANKRNAINNIVAKSKNVANDKKFNFIYKNLIKLVKANQLSYKSAFRYLNENELINAIKNKKKIGGLFTKIYNNNPLNDNDYRYTDAERNLILSNILVDQINSDPRYDVESINAVSINPETGKFNVPLNDRINHARFEQLICSIIKKTFVKQGISGGPVVQASSYGLSKKLNIRYYKPNSKELVMSKAEFDKVQKKSGFASYDDYLNYIYTDKDGNKITPIVAYHEIAITIPWNKSIADRLIIREGSRKGQLMTPQEAIDEGIITEEMLYSIGYRIPTENKSSIYPMKVVEFIPEGIGTCIMLPEEITAVTGSDFDIDKTFVMFKSFDDINGQMTENKDLTTKDGINNKLFDIYMSIFHNEKIQFLAHNPQGFEDIRKAQLIAKIGKYSNEYKYEELKNKSSDDLIDIYENINPLSGQNIHSINTQLDFFEKNMAGSQVLGMFASSNTAHGFCQIHNQFLQNDGKEKMWLDVKDLRLNGEIFDDKNKLYIDGVYNRDKTMYISTAMGEFVGASADIVKDDVLTDFNANPNTVNILTLLIRSGFSHDFVCMFLNQPVVKYILQSPTPHFELNTWITKYKKTNNALYSVDTETGKYIIPDDLKFTTDELYEHLQDEGNPDVAHANAYQLYVALQLRKLLNVSQDFLTLSLETRYNSIKNSVGPSILNNIIAKERHESFVNSDNFGVKNAQNIVYRNPLLNILYEEQYGIGYDVKGSLLQRILNKNTIEYNNTFLKAFRQLKTYLNKDFTDNDIELINMFMNDFDYYRLTFGKNPFINQDRENRETIYNFPDKLKEFKSYCLSNNINNDFINLLFLDKYGNLCFNTKRLKAEQINHIKFSIEELLTMKDEKVNNFIEDCFTYFLQKQGFSFDPNGDIKIFPEYLKANVKYGNYTFFEYTSASNFGIPKDDEFFVTNFIVQFFRNHFEYAPKVRMTLDENKQRKAGFNKVTLDNEKMIVHKIKSGNFRSFERNFNNEVDYLPIVKSLKGLYVYAGKNENGDLVYNRVFELGTKGQNNLKEYNANESGFEMEGIVKGVRESIQKSLINNDYQKPSKIPAGQETLFNYIFELYDNNKTSNLRIIYKTELGKATPMTKMQPVTKEVKEEIKKMIDIPNDTKEDVNFNNEQTDVNNDPSPIIDKAESQNNNAQIDTFTDNSRNNMSNEFVVKALKKMTDISKVDDPYKNLFDALYNGDKEKVKSIYDDILANSKKPQFNIVKIRLKKNNITSDRLFKFVEDYLQGKIQENIKDLC